MSVRSTRNHPQPLDLDSIHALTISTVSIEEKVKIYTTYAPRTKEQEKEYLLCAIRCMDLTTLSGDDSIQKVQALCQVAQQPFFEAFDLKVGAVCLYPAFIQTATTALGDCSIPVASVAAGFPTGLLPLAWRLTEIREAVALGAQEIDIVAPRHYSLRQDWQGLYQELVQMRKACGAALLKVILETGHLPDGGTIAKASQVAMRAGADFIKTSTGKEATGATLEAGVIMAQQIRAYEAATGFRVGLKPAGGIRQVEQAYQWLYLVEQELGSTWKAPRYFRIGASSLLQNIQVRLQQHTI